MPATKDPAPPTEWTSAPVLDWLLHKGRHAPNPETLLDTLCERMVTAGMPLARAAVYVSSLHPLYIGTRIVWDEGSVKVQHGGYNLLDDDSRYRQTPIARIRDGERVIRRRIEDPQCPMDFTALLELREEGVTDYVMAELVFGDGTRNSVSLCTRRAGGFTDNDLAQAENLLHVFAMVMENFSQRALARTLVDTYLGTISGRRVLEGSIKRGDADLIDAVIWFSDLRSSTRLAEEQGHRAFFAILDEYFEATAGSVLTHGGEVLRFIGDASLAVFPIGDGKSGESEACRDAVNAARNAIRAAETANAKRAATELPTFEYGIGLHLGQVLYGNIGIPTRLEFSVIGPAANEAARIEALSKECAVPLVVSARVAAAVEGDWRSLGEFDLRGVGRPIEVLTLQDAGGG